MASDGIDFAVHVRPGGRRDAVDGLYDGVLALRVSAPPTDGRANEAVRALLAASFGVRRSEVTITAGHTARRKRIHVAGDAAALTERLDALRAG